METNYFFNWGCGGYNTVLASSLDDAMEKALELCDHSPEWGVVNLVSDADYKVTREYERLNAGMWD